MMIKTITVTVMNIIAVDNNNNNNRIAMGMRAMGMCSSEVAMSYVCASCSTH